MDNELRQFLADLEAIELWCPSEVGDMFQCAGPGYGPDRSKTVYTIVAVDPDMSHDIMCLPHYAKFMCGAWTDLAFFTSKGLEQYAEEGMITKITGPATMLALYYEYGHESESQTEARRLRLQALDEHNHE